MMKHLPSSSITCTSFWVYCSFRTFYRAPSATSSTRLHDYTADADASRRQNGVVIPLRAPARGVSARHGIGIHCHSGSLQDAQTDVLPATARSDMLGVLCDLRDAEMQHTRCEFQTELRCRGAAAISLQHRSLQRRTERMPGRLVRLARPSA